MCLAFKTPKCEDVGLWHNAWPNLLIDESAPPLALFRWIEEGGLVEAHNAFFEMSIWNNIMVPRFDWPEIPFRQWRCSAAKACNMNLPRALGKAGAALGLPIQKNEEGRRIMLKLSKPRKPLKAEKEWMLHHGQNWKDVILWHESNEDVETMHQYCKDDVLSEQCLSESLPDLSEQELRYWRIDQKMNLRGIRFDRKMAEAALKLAAEHRAKLNEELYDLCGIDAGTKRQQILHFLQHDERLHEIQSTGGDVLEWHLKNTPNISDRAKRIMEITKQVNKTSIRKYQAILDKTDEDGFARDFQMYAGANTHRWTAKGIQVHNLPRGFSENMEEVCEDIKDGDLKWLSAMYGDPLETLSKAIRGSIIPAEGKEFFIADYSSIEARVVLWLAGATKALDVFRSGKDIYCDMATGIYGYEVNKDDHPKERQFGKQAVLGLGFGMGFIKFLITCRRYNISFSKQDVLKILGPENYKKYTLWVKKKLLLSSEYRAEADRNGKLQASRYISSLKDAREDPKAVVHELALMKYTVDVYRDRYPEVPELWKELATAAISAVQWLEQARNLESTKFDSKFVCADGKLSYEMAGDFLHCVLPSGRPIPYYKPSVSMTKSPWGEYVPHLSYMSTDTFTKKWVRIGTYGGKLTENAVQATSREITAKAVENCWDRRDIYLPVMTVHDELVSEAKIGTGDLKEFEALMVKDMSWTEGCPVEAGAERYERYRKA